eukprot:176075-Amphidinium_carterae.1
MIIITTTATAATTAPTSVSLWLVSRIWEEVDPHAFSVLCGDSVMFDYLTMEVLSSRFPGTPAVPRTGGKHRQFWLKVSRRDLLHPLVQIGNSKGMGALGSRKGSWGAVVAVMKVTLNARFGTFGREGWLIAREIIDNYLKPF